MEKISVLMLNSIFEVIEASGEEPSYVSYRIVYIAEIEKELTIVVLHCDAYDIYYALTDSGCLRIP